MKKLLIIFGSLVALSTPLWAFATISTIQQVSDRSNPGTFITITMTSVAAGNQIICGTAVEFSTSATSTVVVSSTPALTFSSSSLADDGNGRVTKIFYATNVAANTYTVTGSDTDAGSNNIALYCAEIHSTNSGAFTADGQSSLTGSDASPNSGSFTSTGADYFLSVVQNGGTTVTADPSWSQTGWTQQSRGAVEDLTRTTATTTNATYSLGAGGSWSDSAAAFKEPAGGGGGGGTTGLGKKLMSFKGPIKFKGKITLK